ncbi:MAG: hypothetical protein IKB73_03595 [Ruminococcus sp.]|nr:hypothetical protein [Ruminococcus sp.]
MGMINDFIENAKVVVQKFGEKANDTYDIAKLKSVKCRINNDIEKKYKALGNKYYILSKENKLEDADFKAEITALDELYAQYDSIVKQIDNVKNMKRCPVCSKLQSGDKPFCAYCGSKL